MFAGVRKPVLGGLGLLCAVVGALVFASAPALAAAPESPITSAPAEVGGSTAVLQGLVNPLKLGVVGWFFEYKAGGVCTGGVTTPLEGPEETEMRPVAVGIAGLTQETTYTVCLVAENEAKERTAGAPVTFTTITPEPPAGLEAEPVAARTATLHGVLNPKHAGEAGSYEFVYRQSETECMGGEPGPQEEKSTAEEAATGAEGQVAMPAQVTGLEPNLPYTFCLRAKNEAGEEALSAPVTFTTLAAAPTVAGESVSSVEASAATLEAEIVPEGAATTYHFVYVEAAKYRPDCAECEDEPTNAYALGAGTPESESIGADDAAHAAEARVTGLAPGTTYHYSVVATNAESPAGGTPGPDKTFTTNPAPSTATTGGCPNEQLRAEQPFGLTLPDCRAYEMVSPVVTGGQDATDSFATNESRAALSGEAVTYGSKGTFADPTGETEANQFLSRRNAGMGLWETQAITPPQEPVVGGGDTSYLGIVFNPDLTEGVANTSAPLVSGAPGGKVEKESGIYVDDFAASSYRYVGAGFFPLGASSDLSHVVFGGVGQGGAPEYVFEWVDGARIPVAVANTVEEPNAGEELYATVGATLVNSSSTANSEDWQAVSNNGSRVYFTSPAVEIQQTEEGPLKLRGQLYVRLNAEQPQSPLAGPETNGTGTLTGGSATVTSLVAAASLAAFEGGSEEVTLLPGERFGQFVVGDTVSGRGIEAGTTITHVAGTTLTLSAPATSSSGGSGVTIYSPGPGGFAVGQSISGNGIPTGTTVTGVGAGTLTLSAPVVSSGAAVQLHAGGGCTVPSDACTVEVSASQRLAANPAGTQLARYWGASADGSKVFFTSPAELTEDAVTGGGAENLYEYDFRRPAGARLEDLSADRTPTDVNGAEVQGVAQISTEGSYVYFVARGVLKGEHGEALRNSTGLEPVPGEDNLYVSHEGGVPAFIATLSAGDETDWHDGGFNPESGPAINTAVVSPSGARLAFLSELSLTGYDNQQAQPGDCEGERCREIYLYDAEAPGLLCASCNPTGARPRGPASFGQRAESYATYRARNLMGNGTLFFDSSDALTPQTSDDRQNVYEYEGGRIQAISNVDGGSESFFIDASGKEEDGEEGGNVFFGSADRLLVQDKSNNVVVWDARVDGGFPVTAAAPSCDNADSCKPPESSQPAVFGAPSSSTFSGPGNSTPAVAPLPPKKATVKKTVKCKKPKKLSRGKCVRPKKKTKARKSAKRATSNRRANS